MGNKQENNWELEKLLEKTREKPKKQKAFIHGEGFLNILKIN
jgi:hypothetical protein